jgi:hypothetical protein
MVALLSQATDTYTEDTAMRGTIGFDGTLQMFCEPTHDVDVTRLKFIRWLVENRQLEHPPFGEPSGELAERLEER